MAQFTADGASSPAPDRGAAVLAVSIATFGLASIAVFLRVLVRLRLVKNWSADDYFICLAWGFAFAVSFTISYGTRFGLGRHDIDIGQEQRRTLKTCEYVFSVLYNPALMASKTSILVFYLRISKNTQKILRVASIITLVVVNIAGAVLTLLNIFQCRPLQAAWEPVASPTSESEALSLRCIPILTEFICSAPVNIVTDLAILALPLPVLTAIQLPKRQKLVLVGTFCVGIFVTVIDVVRIYYLQEAVLAVPSTLASTAATFGQQREFAWNASLSLMWSAVEVNTIILCACVPTLRPLIVRIPAAVPRRWRNRSRSFVVEKHASSDRPGVPPVSPRRDPVSQTAASRSDHGSVDFAAALATPPGARAPAARWNEAASPRSATAAADRRANRVNRVNRPQRPYRGTSFVDFITMEPPHSMLKTPLRESIGYCAIVTVLFVLWGVSYGLLNTLNGVVAAIAGMSVEQTLGLTSIYFGAGYLMGPLIGMWVLRHNEPKLTPSPPSRLSRAASVRVGMFGSAIRASSAGGPDGSSFGGFKSTFMAGLCIYGIGTIMFWPSAVLASFPGFLVCNLIVGCGLAVLETAANPFLALCGPPEYSDARLLIAQGIQALSSVVIGVLAQSVFFNHFTGGEESGTSATYTTTTLLDVQWTYLAITLVCAFLALVFYYARLPEATEAEFAMLNFRLEVDPEERVLLAKPKPVAGSNADRMPLHGRILPRGIQLRTLSLVLAVAAQWTYVGAQESMSIWFTTLVVAGLPRDEAVASARASVRPPGLSMSLAMYQLVVRTAFAVSRFAAGVICILGVKQRKRLRRQQQLDSAHESGNIDNISNNTRRRGGRSWWPLIFRFPTPRTLLNISAIFTMAVTIVIVAIRPAPNPQVMMVLAALFYLSEGPQWPLIFSLGLRGQGSRTKMAAAFITMGGSGSVFWPFVMHAISGNDGAGIQNAFGTVVALLAVILVYPVLLGLVGDLRRMVDPVPGSGWMGRQQGDGRDLNLASVGRKGVLGEVLVEKPAQTVQPARDGVPLDFTFSHDEGALALTNTKA